MTSVNIKFNMSDNEEFPHEIYVIIITTNYWLSYIFFRFFQHTFAKNKHNFLIYFSKKWKKMIQKNFFIKKLIKKNFFSKNWFFLKKKLKKWKCPLFLWQLSETSLGVSFKDINWNIRIGWAKVCFLKLYFLIDYSNNFLINFTIFNSNHYFIKFKSSQNKLFNFLKEKVFFSNLILKYAIQISIFEIKIHVHHAYREW